MPAERTYAHPAVKADVGRAALKRGPLVYCIEQVDNPAMPISDYRIYRDSKLSVAHRKDLFSGVSTITTYGGRIATDDWGNVLYRNKPPKVLQSKITAIPYYLWSNREKGPMTVWIPEE